MRDRVKSVVHSMKGEIIGVLIFVGVLWAIFLIDFLPYVSLGEIFSLRPRTLFGSIGIVTMPFVHNGWVHIISNTIPLVVLMILLAGSRAQSWLIISLIVVIGGVLTWLLGNGGKQHVGASGLVFGLVTFLISSGFFEKRMIPMGISVLVGLLYGTTLIRGLIPFFPTGVEHVSWAGHWCGAIAGVVVAYVLTRDEVKQRLSPAKVTT